MCKYQILATMLRALTKSRILAIVIASNHIYNMGFIKNILHQNNSEVQEIQDTGSSYLVCLCDNKNNVVAVAPKKAYGKNEVKNLIALPTNTYNTIEEASASRDMLQKYIFNHDIDRKDLDNIFQEVEEQCDTSMFSMLLTIEDDILATMSEKDYELKVMKINQDLMTMEDGKN